MSTDPTTKLVSALEAMRSSWSRLTQHGSLVDLADQAERTKTVQEPVRSAVSDACNDWVELRKCFFSLADHTLSGRPLRGIPLESWRYYVDDMLPQGGVFLRLAFHVDPTIVCKKLRIDPTTLRDRKQAQMYSAEEDVLKKAAQIAFERMYHRICEIGCRIDSGELKDDGSIEELQYLEEYLIVEEMAVQGYFQPDQWRQNIEDLGPVLLTPDAPDIPPPVQERLSATAQAFAFGNWLSAIVMARSTLEYTLSHYVEKPAFEKKQDLYHLIEIARVEFPSLEEEMSWIRRTANEVVHSGRQADVTSLMSTVDGSRTIALKCVSSLKRILSVLFGAAGVS